MSTLLLKIMGRLIFGTKNEIHSDKLCTNNITNACITYTYDL